MAHKKTAFFSNFKIENWKNLVLVIVFCFYCLSFLGNFFMYRGLPADYLAFWSVGKIANQMGFSEIYDLTNLRNTQDEGLDLLSRKEQKVGPSFPTMPVPYFALFIVPFQLLARVGLITGFWVWTIINLVVLFAYLVFLLRKMNPGNVPRISILKLLILMLLSWPVFFNMACGQVEAFLLVCAGEFMRNAINKRPVLSGFWLGGLLLKPQLLIIIIPVLLIMYSWKVLLGFLASSGIVLITSFILSGFTGMKALFNLWTNFSLGMPLNSPEAMINWRMVGYDLNYFFDTSFGWFITGLGITLTLVALFHLIKYNPLCGSPQWVLTMLAVFSATLAITWHSHYHMAVVVIPFIIYAALNKLIPEKIIFSWGVITPLTLMFLLMIEMLLIVTVKVNLTGYNGMVIAFSGFVLNLAVLISSLQIRDARDVN